MTPDSPRAADARSYLAMTRLLDDIEKDHPEVSAPLRLTLLRSRRSDQPSWIDEDRFRDVVAELRRPRTAAAS